MGVKGQRWLWCVGEFSGISRLPVYHWRMVSEDCGGVSRHREADSVFVGLY